MCKNPRGSGIPGEVPWVKVVLKSCLRSLINYCPHVFVDKAVLEICGAGLGCSLPGNLRTLDFSCVCTHEVSQNRTSSVILCY